MSPPRLSVAVVQGGASTEAEVSRASAVGVANALTEAGHLAVRLELDPHLAESLRTGGYDVVFPIAHGAVGEDQLDSPDVVHGHTILEGMRPPGIGGDVAADRAGALARRVRGVVEPGPPERAGQPEIDHAGLNDRIAVARVDLDDPLAKLGPLPRLP